MTNKASGDFRSPESVDYFFKNQHSFLNGAGFNNMSSFARLATHQLGHVGVTNVCDYSNRNYRDSSPYSNSKNSMKNNEEGGGGNGKGMTNGQIDKMPIMQKLQLKLNK